MADIGEGEVSGRLSRAIGTTAVRWAPSLLARRPYWVARWLSLPGVSPKQESPLEKSAVGSVCEACASSLPALPRPFPRALVEVTNRTEQNRINKQVRNDRYCT